MLHTEFVRTMNGYNRTSSISQNSVYNNYKPIEEAITFLAPENINVPVSVDWRVKGAVTEV